MLLSLFVFTQRVKRRVKQAISGDIDAARFAEMKAYERLIEDAKMAKFWALRTK